MYKRKMKKAKRNVKEYRYYDSIVSVLILGAD